MQSTVQRLTEQPFKGKDVILTSGRTLPCLKFNTRRSSA
jgi:hypothetical protein